MQITQITVTLGYTWNLGSYSSVRPEVSLTAEVAEGEDPTAVLAELQKQARSWVEAEIDEALESVGQPPHFRQDEVAF